MTLLILFGYLLIAHAKPALSFKIYGLKDEPLKNANERLAVIEKSIGPLNTAKIQTLYKQGKGEIEKAIEPYGYFQATITHTLTHKKNDWLASYYVKPGPQIRVSELEIRIEGPGKNNPALQKTLHSLPVKRGDFLNVPNYKKSRSMLINTAQDQGYIKAYYSNDKTIVDVLNYRTVMKLTLDTGPRYYFGPINFSKSPFTTKFLNRFVNFKAGEPFNADKLTQLQNNYSGTGYFKGVTMDPQVPETDSKATTVPVDVGFIMNKQKQYRIGLGYGTVTGPRISGGGTWRWVNRWGQKFNLSGFLSREFSQLDAQYLIPGVRVLPDYYTINASIYQITPPHGKWANVFKIGPGYLWVTGKWTWEVRLNQIWERWRLGKNDPNQYGRLLQPTFTVTRLSVPNPTKVENGSRFTFAIRGASTAALSTVSYLQPEGSLKIIKTLWSDNRFIVYANIGYTLVKDQDKLPLSEQYFAGGPGSILGYSVQNFGPGRYLTVANFDYQRRIYGDLYAGVFYDIGNAFNSFNHYGKNLKKSAGITGVYRTSIGDITVYVAKALSKKGNPTRFGFMIGPEL